MHYRIINITVFLVILTLAGLKAFSGGTTAKTEYWMEIFSDGKRIGFSHTIIDKSHEKTVVSERSSMNISIMGISNEINTKSRYTISNSVLSNFSFEMYADSVDLDIKGEITEGEIFITGSGDSKKKVRSKFDKDYVIPSMIPFRLSSEGLQKGKKETVYIFDPLTFYTGADINNMKADIRVGDTETVSTPAGNFEAIRVEIDHLGTRSLMWITSEGRLIKESVPPGFVSFLSTEESSKRNAAESIDLGEKIAISVKEPIKNPRDVKKLVVKLSGLKNFEGLDINDGYRQFLEGNKLDIITSWVTDGTPAKPDNLVNKDIYLGKSNLIDPGETEIAERSGLIVGDEKNTLKKAELINTWVYKNLEKIPIMSIPDAGEVLERKKGDCNEHSVLFTALARAAGIPAKVIMGLLYLDGKFHYHAWNEIYDKQWITVDPTLGQLPADATHIKILEGDISRSPEIIRVAGKLNLDVLYYE